MVEVRARHYYGRLARLNRWVIKRGAHVYVSLWVRPACVSHLDPSVYTIHTHPCDGHSDARTLAREHPRACSALQLVHYMRVNGALRASLPLPMVGLSTRSPSASTR